MIISRHDAANWDNLKLTKIELRNKLGRSIDFDLDISRIPDEEDEAIMTITVREEPIDV